MQQSFANRIFDCLTVKCGAHFKVKNHLTLSIYCLVHIRVKQGALGGRKFYSSQGAKLYLSILA